MGETSPTARSEFVAGVIEGIEPARECLAYLGDQLAGDMASALTGNVCEIIHPMFDPTNPDVVTFTIRVNLGTRVGRVTAHHTPHTGEMA